MTTNAKKTKPTREQLVALATQLADAPVIRNDAQAALWQSIGRAQGWSAMSATEKAAFRERLAAAI